MGGSEAETEAEAEPCCGEWQYPAEHSVAISPVTPLHTSSPTGPGMKRGVSRHAAGSLAVAGGSLAFCQQLLRMLFVYNIMFARNPRFQQAGRFWHGCDVLTVKGGGTITRLVVAAAAATARYLQTTLCTLISRPRPPGSSQTVIVPGSPGCALYYPSAQDLVPPGKVTVWKPDYVGPAAARLA